MRPIAVKKRSPESAATYNEGEIEKSNHDRAYSCLRSGVRWDRVRRVITEAAPIYKRGA